MGEYRRLFFFYWALLCKAASAWIGKNRARDRPIGTTLSAWQLSEKMAKPNFRHHEPTGKAFPLQTPHSGRHFWPSHPAYQRSMWKRHKRRGRFTEGWYYRLTLNDAIEESVSFAFIISIEDPGRRRSDLRLACIQVVGPDDGYIIQTDRDDTRFWAFAEQQALGYTFAYQPGVDVEEMKHKTLLSVEEWNATVQSGFQVLPLHLMGRVRGRDGTKGGISMDTSDRDFVAASCDFDFTVEPLCGWGDVNATQMSTAGWLSSFAVFEPHWQVTMADARATGNVVWNNRTYNFINAPFYAEKNWGAALPSRWYWTQCNSFNGYEQLSVTAGGGIRKIPFGVKEALGMVCVHYNGAFYEAVPWSGAMDWEVETWGSWKLRGNCTSGERPFDVEVSYTCDPNNNPGLVFRAPTPDEGIVRFCRDTFVAETSLTLWELEWDAANKGFRRRTGPPLIDRATSLQGGAEVGGAPWWDKWTGRSKVKKPVRFLLRLPLRMKHLQQHIQRYVLW